MDFVTENHATPRRHHHYDNPNAKSKGMHIHGATPISIQRQTEKK
jgi:hypothetical protein